MIINIMKSPMKHKRFRVIMDNNKYYDFGLDTGSTFIDHKNNIIKKYYWARHYANSTEKN